MTNVLLLACVVACPVVMLGMMWMMRGGGRRDRSEEDKE
jgi:hypothetical protein